MYKETSMELLSFLEKCPSCFHATAAIKSELSTNGYTELLESKKWDIKSGGKYFVTRNSSSIIAFTISNITDSESFNIIASHSDSPVFKVKDKHSIEVDKKYLQINTEKYGGMLLSTWFDRPLSVAGRLVVKDKNTLRAVLVNVNRDLLLIPNVAIHMNKEANDGMKYNPQVDTLPLYGTAPCDNSLLDAVAKAANVDKDSVAGFDLFVYNRMKPTVWGAQNEFISAPKLDDLQCAFSSLKAFMASTNEKSTNVYCCFDNEEVGSVTKQGAASTFLYDVLTRINECLGKSSEDYRRALASSMMLSADNAHAVHPNHPEKSDLKNRVYMNEGIVIKYNANQKYTTDAFSDALFRGCCERAEVPYQTYANRSDMAGGGTLGNIASTHISINTVDIGLPQLAMHSSYETAGIKDTYYMIKAMTEFYNSHIEETESGALTVTW